MDEEQNQQQKNYMAEMAKQQAEQAAQRVAKEMAKAAMKAVTQALKQAALAISQAVVAALPYIIPIVIGVLIIIILLAGIKMLLDQDTVASAAEIMQDDLSQYISIKDDHFEIDEALYDEWIKKLEAQGMDGGEYLGKNSKYLKAIIKAELASTYPKLKNEDTNLDDNNFQGTVEIIRRSPDAKDEDRYTEANKKDDNEILLTYIEPEKFEEMLKSLKEEYDEEDYEELRRYFTIPKSEETNATTNTTDTTTTKKKSSGIKIVIPKYNGTSVDSQEISYQNSVNKYSVPVEFLIAQLQVTQNPEYIYSLADMAVNNSKIELVIQETKTTTTTTTVTNTIKKDADGNTVTDENGNPKIESETSGPNTKVSYGIMKYIREVDTWIVKVTQGFMKKDPPTSQTTGELIYDQVGTFTQTIVEKIEFIATPATTNETANEENSENN